MKLLEIKKVIAYTDGEEFFPTKEAAIEAVKRKEIEKIVDSCLSSVFNYDQDYIKEEVVENLMKKIDEIINIMEEK